MDKASDQGGDLICSRVQCEMTSVEHVNLRVRHIVAISFRLRELERAVIPSPDHQQAWMRESQPCLPCWVGVDIGSIVVEQVASNVSLAGLAEKGKFIGS